MTGVILCDGHSTRMQKDKGLLFSGRVTWAGKDGAVAATHL
jgi:molybdopterin-guanine dinucleotide biosynthesis protein A